MSKVRRPMRRVRRPAPKAGWARRLVVMVKAPVAGRVKTRLGREAGVSLATRFSRQVAAALLDRVGRDRRWRTILAVTPDGEARGRFWPPRLARRRQGGGDLGARMQRIVDRLPPGPVVIVGSDVPGLRAAHVAQAFKALGSHEAVCGPAPDGGYWLIGFKRARRVPRAFAGVRWSTAHARADTLANLRRSSVATLALLPDVDRAADLAAYSATAGRRVPAAQSTKGRGVEMDRAEAETNREMAPREGSRPEHPPLKADELAVPSSPAQYSPAQVLQTGRRAEAQGRPDYAVKFYQHLVEYYPATTEGKEARESLERLADTGRKPSRALERAALFPDIAPPPPGRDLRPVAAGEALARLAYRGDVPMPAPHEGGIELPPAPSKNYGLGKSLARLLAAFGLFLMLAGIVFPVATLAGKHLGPFSVDVAGLPLGVLLAPIAFGLGIGMLVASQAAFAVFDQAQNLRELRGIDRSRE